MTISSGSRLGPYEVVSPSARGNGRGLEGRDKRVGREVAVKVLPEAFFEDESRRNRFERRPVRSRA